MSFPPALRIHQKGLRIMVGALLGGPLLLVILGFALGRADTGDSMPRLLAMVGAALGAGALGLRFPVRDKIAAHGRKSIREGTFQPHGAMKGEAWDRAIEELGDTARFYAIYQSATIVPVGLGEMGLILCGFGFFLGGPIWAAAVVVGLAALQFLLNWPTERGYLEWQETQQRLLRDGS